MAGLARSIGPWMTGIRWVARGSALLLFALVVLFAIGEGLPNPLTVSAVVNVQCLAFVILLAGLIAGWRWEGLGAGLVLGGLLLFHLVNFISAGRLAGGLFPVFFIPGVLFLVCFLIDRKKPKAEDA